MVYKIQTDPYNLQIGDPKKSTTQNIKDSNFGKLGGHLDEVNPSTSKNFLAQSYNTQKRNDVTIKAYNDKDKFPETSTTCKLPDTSNAEIIELPKGEYKINRSVKSLKVDCVTQ